MIRVEEEVSFFWIVNGDDCMKKVDFLLCILLGELFEGIWKYCYVVR